MAVEAACVVFGLSMGVESVDARPYDGGAALERWMKRLCLDYRVRKVAGHYTVDLLFHKPVSSVWLTNIVQIYAKRWGFKRSQWNRDNIRVIPARSTPRGVPRSSRPRS